MTNRWPQFRETYTGPRLDALLRGNDARPRPAYRVDEDARAVVSIPAAPTLDHRGLYAAICLLLLLVAAIVGYWLLTTPRQEQRVLTTETVAVRDLPPALAVPVVPTPAPTVPTTTDVPTASPPNSTICYDVTRMAARSRTLLPQLLPTKRAEECGQSR